MTPEQEFQRRAAHIPPHGVGLSVDIYAPDVFELVDALEAAGIQHYYLDVIKALALEVDTKPLERIIPEFKAFAKRFGPLLERARRCLT